MNKIVPIGAGYPPYHKGLDDFINNFKGNKNDLIRIRDNYRKIYTNIKGHHSSISIRFPQGAFEPLGCPEELVIFGYF